MKKPFAFPCDRDRCRYVAQCRSHLDEHVKYTHEKLKDISCAHCEYTTSHSKCLLLHCKSAHPGLMPFK